MGKTMGRPPEYTEAIAKEICLAISTSSHGLRKLCKDNPHWPSYPVIFRWLLENTDNFRDRYAIAKEAQCEVFADEIMEIADNGSNDIGNDGKVKKEVINRSRLRVDSRKWLMSKLQAKKYGDKQEHDVKVNDVTRQTRETENEYKNKY